MLGSAELGEASGDGETVTDVDGETAVGVGTGGVSQSHSGERETGADGRTILLVKVAVVGVTAGLGGGVRATVGDVLARGLRAAFGAPPIPVEPPLRASALVVVGASGGGSATATVDGGSVIRSANTVVAAR